MKFQRPKRFDDNLINNGVEFAVYNNNGDYYGTFICRHLDPTSQRTELFKKRVQQQYKAKMMSKEWTDEDTVKVIFIEGCLAGWKDIKDEKGKEVPFTIDNAMAYFDMSDDEARFVMATLSQFADNPLNFAPTNVAEEAAKN